MSVVAEHLREWWGVAVLLASIAAAAWALVHALLSRRDPRSVVYWIVIIGIVPLLGSALYAVFGVNRVKREAARRRAGPTNRRYERGAIAAAARAGVSQARLAESLPAADRGLAIFDRAVEKLSRCPLTDGNAVRVLENGDETFPAMLEAIAGAQRSLTLATYIFERQGIGCEFADALADAVRRGVETRVMIDDAGTRYSWPPITGLLRKLGVPVQRFMPNRRVLRLLLMNLRNHRKIMVADGRIGFTGGMNIRQGNILSSNAKHPTRDLHFRLDGPVVAQLQDAFADDWLFCSGERLEGDLWFPPLERRGEIFARGIADGPDENFQVMSNTILAALSAARSSVKIVTPYFLPDPPIQAALSIAALRGVAVEIVLPGVSNLPYVAWASRRHYLPLLERGCRIFEQPAPFDHSKIFVVDGQWSLIGSANWDPRSLILNFEQNVACFGAGLARELSARVGARIEAAREITVEEMERQPAATRLRDSLAALFTPIL